MQVAALGPGRLAKPNPVGAGFFASLTRHKPYATLAFNPILNVKSHPSRHMPELDATQRRAVESSAKTVFVTGPPGSGKTETIARRFDYLTRNLGVPLSSVLVLTFSNAMVVSLRRAFEGMIGGSYSELWLHTYHSFARRISEEQAGTHADSGTILGAPPTFITPFKEYLIVRELLRKEQSRLKSDLKRVAAKSGFAREASDFFRLLKQHLIFPDEFGEIARNLSARLSDLAQVYSAYSDYLAKRNWAGPGDSVALAVETIREDAGLRERLRSRFEHILVDEFQEVDPAQLCLLELLASDNTSLFLVGDENQRIYRFHGSMADQFSRMARQRPGAEVIRLEKSYRLPQVLLKASQNLIAHNLDAGAESIPIDKNAELELSPYSDAIEQAYDIARDIKRRVLDTDGTGSSPRFSDFGILCRSASRSAPALEEAFSYYDIPYVLSNSARFHKHPIARSVIAFVRLLIDPSDDHSLRRVLGVSAFGIDTVGLGRLIKSVKRTPGESLYELLRRAVGGGRDVEGDLGASLEKFFDYFGETRRRALDTDCPSGLIHSIMADLFFGEIVNDDDIGRGIRDAGNLRLVHEVATDIEEIFSGMRGRCTLPDVAGHMEHAFAHFTSQLENDTTEDAVEGVRIMTVHQAKGMEFPFVYLVDATDEFFPRLGRNVTLLDGKSLGQLTRALGKHGRARPADAAAPELFLNPEEQLREERRLAYVGLSRACRKLVICYTEESGASEPVLPSPFIDEFLGGTAEDDKAYPCRSARDSSDPALQVDRALNRPEAESALRHCASGLRADSESCARLSRLFESLRLDSHFILAEYPFAAEPSRPLELSNHVYSASQLSTYLACPRRFFYERLLRIAPERPEDFGLWQLVHRVLELFHEEVEDFTENPKLLESRIDEIFLRIWNGAGDGGGKEAFREQYPALLQQAELERRAHDILKRYIRTETEQASERKIVAREELIEFDVAGHRFVAKIDRIDSSAQGHHIIDYKTSANAIMRAPTIKKKFINIAGEPDYAPEDFQLPLYLLAAKSAGYEPIELSYYWLAQETSSGMFKKASLSVGEGGSDPLTDEEMAAAKNNIVSVVERIAAGDFRPRPAKPSECKRCIFEGICDFDNEASDDY